MTGAEARSRLRNLPGWSLRSRGGKDGHLRIVRAVSAPSDLASTLFAAYAAEVARVLCRPVKIQVSGSKVTLYLPGKNDLFLSEIDFETASRISLVSE